MVWQAWRKAMVYQWKDGARFGADAQEVGEEIMSIDYRDARSVLDLARESSGELHTCFEWDDPTAAEEYRLEQARNILRMLVVVETVNTPQGPQEVKFRAFESVRFESTEEKTMVYVPTREALADEILRGQVLGRLRDVIAQAEKTAETYSYLVPRLKATLGHLKLARETVKA